MAQYYSGRVQEHGPCPRGVDWTCAPTQELRFVQLLKIAGRRRRFTLNDLGCGYGALLGFLRNSRDLRGVDYHGADISPAMIEHARRLWRGDSLAGFSVSSSLPQLADYSVASGLFNVQLGFPRPAWHALVEGVLQELDRTSRQGFAVNFMLPPQPGVEPLEGLYRTQPQPWIDFCKGAFAAEVTLIRDYGLREFTLLVRRPAGRRRREGGSARHGQGRQCYSL